MISTTILVLLAASSQMDGAMGGYTFMEIEAGRMKGNFATGAIEEMTEGVRIRLMSEDPDLAPLPIAAGSMKFTWVEGSTSPATILMERNVKVNHPDADVSAERAEWNFDSGELVFSGNPVVNSERLVGLRGERMTLNLKTNTFEVTRMRADQVPLQGIGEPAAPPPSDALRTTDIADWPRLIDTLKAEAQSEEASPGKRILSRMTTQNRQLLVQLDTDMLVERKEDLVRLINSVLQDPGLYDGASWSDRTLPGEAAALLEKDRLAGGEQARLNRLLLESAYPFAFTRP